MIKTTCCGDQRFLQTFIDDRITIINHGSDRLNVNNLLLEKQKYLAPKFLIYGHESQKATIVNAMSTKSKILYYLEYYCFIYIEPSKE